jgi:opacity protein-like surface antigen
MPDDRAYSAAPCAPIGREGAAVRWFICAVVLLALTPRAFADDLDILRGTESVGEATFPRWSGFYFGGDVAFGSGNANFSNTTQAPIAYALRDTLVEQDFSPSSWSLLGSATGQSTFLGGFVGFATQWQDLVLGGEATYAHPNVTATAPSNPMGRTFTQAPDSSGDITEYEIDASASASLHLTDYATLRARAGWVANNIFLPYGFFGFAVGRANYTSSSNVAWTTATTAPQTVLVGTQLITIPAQQPVIPCAGTETCNSYAVGSSEGGNIWMYGIDMGVGVDIAVMQNVFLRGEFEYVHFLPIKGITLDFATARAGVGLKF